MKKNDAFINVRMILADKVDTLEWVSVMTWQPCGKAVPGDCFEAVFVVFLVIEFSLGVSGRNDDRRKVAQLVKGLRLIRQEAWRHRRLGGTVEDGLRLHQARPPAS